MSKWLFIAVILLLSGCTTIDFGYGVRRVNSESFIDECNFSKVDADHYVYKNTRPSIVFIYSDAVEHCRSQAQVFSSVAAMYSEGVFFWAIEYSDAKPLLSYFPNNGRLPIYLYINQNCAQMFAPETTTLADMRKHIGEAFGIYYKL
ncbi:MAG: hypothetical protein K6F33_13715 [Bacteroidales bacterium]|nr:hypothetical protein [Bacteroidales bacterium]